MSRFARIRRRPDHWSSPHEHARARAAERLDGPLGLAEATWLDEHLADCRDCAAIAAAYESDRKALRALRDAAPEPPRDLWARTSAALERERGAAGHQGAAALDRRIPIGALSGIAVIAVVVGVSLASGGLFDGADGDTAMTVPATAVPAPTLATASGSLAPETAAARPTPFSVGAGVVEWFGKEADGSVAYRSAAIRKVCPADGAADCATLDDAARDRLALTVAPKSIIGSPTQQQAIIVSDDGAGGQSVVLMSLPTPSQTEDPVPLPSASPPPASSGSPEPTSSPASTEPPPTVPPATASPTGSDTSATSEPSASTEPSTEPSASTEPPISPAPTFAASLALASDITVVGEAAAFSADGAWFAFTARPADGSGGPDIYVWHVGDDAARQLTEGGITSFASWSGDEIVASRPGPDLVDAASRPVTVVIDPETAIERPAGDLWLPVVDPTGSRAVAWAGTVVRSVDGTAVSPSEGRLDLLPWSPDTGASVGDGATQVVSETAISDFDVRWDETGTWFATWVADPSGTAVGRLSLYRIDPATGLLERPDGAPADVPALPGFSIGEGRLAWATPPGQGGEGSHVRIVAWAPEGVGTVETAPGEGLIVVR